MTISWYLSLTAALLLGPWGSLTLSALAPENEVPLRPTNWLQEDKVTTVNLPKGRTRRLYFTLRKRTTSMSVTVSPCAVPIEWTLTARMLKDKPKNPHCKWSAKKSLPEVWWRNSGREAKIYTFTGNALDVYTGPAYAPASIYILRLKSREQDTKVSVYLHEGPEPSGVFPQLPADPRVHTLGVGMTSVTLSWAASSSVPLLGPTDKQNHEYCVLVNRKHNYRSLCAAQEEIRNEGEKEYGRETKDKQIKDSVWPVLKDWWWQQWDTLEDRPLTHNYEEPDCICKGTENVCTVSDLLPDTQYYFDVFVIDRKNGTSAAYTGTFSRTHEEAQPAVTVLREGQVQWVTLQDPRSSRQQGEQIFSFRPRGRQQNGLLTLQSCDSTHKVKVTVSTKGKVLMSQEVGERVAQIWLQGGPVYLIQLQIVETPSVRSNKGSRTSKVSLKMQASSAYHRRAAPVFPATLQMKSFNKLRTCNSVTLAWMGTEERSLYCVYQRKLPNNGKKTGSKGDMDQCLSPETRPSSERVLCKYFQELNPRRAVTTAVIGGLEPGVVYMFDVYLVRRWGLPIKYYSKTVRTRREC
ncbi:protein NDNF [Chanos chanos]|uniref:Protein NDNF n=1 Tax=Chanos chanos TaxID=29144 RepID=A0A6J2WH02_CHACN|nr:protein NDNF-like [Chanos chanos]